MKRWISLVDSSVLSMAGLRFVSAMIELTAAILMLLSNDVKKALVINTSLAIIGPLILVFTMTIGLINLSGELSFQKLTYIFLGVGLIIYGIYK